LERVVGALLAVVVVDITSHQMAADTEVEAAEQGLLGVRAVALRAREAETHLFGVGLVEIKLVVIWAELWVEAVDVTTIQAAGAQAATVA
jgi:hypothetical protein